MVTFGGYTVKAWELLDFQGCNNCDSFFVVVSDLGCRQGVGQKWCENEGCELWGCMGG